MKPFISLYTLYLGFKIFQNSVLKKTNVKYPKRKPILNALCFRWFYRFVYYWWFGFGYGTYQKWLYTKICSGGVLRFAKPILTVTSAIAFIYTHWYSSLEYCFRIINLAVL